MYFSTQAKTGKQLMSTVGQLDSCDGRMGWQAGDGGGQQGLDRPQTKMAVTFAICILELRTLDRMNSL